MLPTSGISTVSSGNTTSSHIKVEHNSESDRCHLKGLDYLDLVTAPLSQRKPETVHVSRSSLYNTLGSALVWKQLSAAGRIACYQTYAQLWQALSERIESLNQGEQLALFVDLDDGSVESTPFFASLMGSENEMTDSRSEGWWQTQCSQIKSPYLPAGKQGVHSWSSPLPGAVEFLTKAHKSGKVKVCYLTSRTSESIKPATMEMLKRFGFPGVDESTVRVATKSKNKPFHFADFGKGCADNFYIGDKLGDLNINTRGMSLPDMRSLVRQEENLGKNAFIMSNPVYGPGCWENITHTPFTASAEESRDTRDKQLTVWQDETNPSIKPVFNPVTEQLEQALLYMQSPAYDALTIQTYRRAAEEARKQLTQCDSKTAVAVMDIDGTVFNNSPWIAGLAQQGQTSSQESLHRFVCSHQAEKVAGVDELMSVYREHNVPVIWVTNRAASTVADQNKVRKAAQAQLEAKGLFKDGDVILIKDDNTLTCQNIPANTKRDRFTAIEKGEVITGRNQILQLIGDDPADLDLSAEPFHSRNTDNWPVQSQEVGSKRVLIPNPVFYRGWNTALANHWYPEKKPTECGLWARNIVELTSWQPANELKAKTDHFLEKGLNDLLLLPRQAES